MHISLSLSIYIYIYIHIHTHHITYCQGQLLCAHSATEGELWVSLLEKANTQTYVSEINEANNNNNYKTTTNNISTKLITTLRLQ